MGLHQHHCCLALQLLMTSRPWNQQQALLVPVLLPC